MVCVDDECAVHCKKRNDDRKNEERNNELRARIKKNAIVKKSLRGREVATTRAVRGIVVLPRWTTRMGLRLIVLLLLLLLKHLQLLGLDSKLLLLLRVRPSLLRVGVLDRV